MKLLLVEPEFPVPPKSKNHKDFLPLPLLKIGAYYRKQSQSNEVELVRGNEDISFIPDKIFITSLFTYWSDSFWESVKFYRDRFPDATIHVGGIYVSLFYEDSEFLKKAREYGVRRHKGLLKYAENCFPDYSLIEENPHPVDYQIMHASRGCVRSCDFCGTWRIEPEFSPTMTVKEKIKRRKIVFYDNNLLANPHIEGILEELVELKKNREILWCESQSGFDGRILVEKPHLARLIRQAGFRYPRIAWDWGFDRFPKMKRQIDLLTRADYGRKDISVFVLYNWDIPFEEMEKKRIKCWRWGVQMSDCRYRPLNQTYDRYNPRKKGQTNDEYHIHEESGWSDALIKQYRRNVRRQNICVRHGFPFYSKDFERKRFGKNVTRATKKMRTRAEKEKYLRDRGIDYWFPGRITYPSKE